MCLLKIGAGAKAVAQSVKCLPCKYEDLNLIPQIHWKKTGMVTNACHSSVEDMETG